MGIIMLGTISFQLRLLVVWLVLSAVVIAVDLLCLRLRHIHGVSASPCLGTALGFRVVVSSALHPAPC